MDKIYEGVICRGSISLGSACMKCEKCKDQLENLNEPVKKPPKNVVEYIEKYCHHHFQETPCGDCVKDAISIMEKLSHERSPLVKLIAHLFFTAYVESGMDHPDEMSLKCYVTNTLEDLYGHENIGTYAWVVDVVMEYNNESEDSP